VEPDPFAVQLEDTDKPPALLVRLGRQEIMRKTDRLEAGTPIEVKPLTGLISGENELYLEANPPLDALDAAGSSHAARVRILQNHRVVAEKTFWSDVGGKVAGTLRFSLSETNEKKDDHGHN
jgi:hypothetical protein